MGFIFHISTRYLDFWNSGWLSGAILDMVVLKIVANLAKCTPFLDNNIKIGTKFHLSYMNGYKFTKKIT